MKFILWYNINEWIRMIFPVLYIISCYAPITKCYTESAKNILAESKRALIPPFSPILRTPKRRFYVFNIIHPYMRFLP